jgi:tetratricopeptide (TPR) repeat protein
MPAVFEGLYLYEIVMLVLGILLFVMLGIGFFYQLLQKRTIVPLLGFFTFPIAMIGYPSIKDIQFKDGLVSIEKTTQQLAENPTDAHLRGTLRQEVANVSARPISSPQNTSVVAQAQYALGNEEAAKSNLQKALEANPRAPAALDLQKRIIAVDTLKEQASQVEADPGNEAAKTKLANTLTQTSQLKFANPAALTQVARAQTAIGDHTKALENTRKVLTITPNSSTAIQLQNVIRARMAATSSTRAAHN